METHTADHNPAAPKKLRSMLEKEHERSFGWALACCSYNRETAQEVLQTVYVKILEGSAVFKGYSGFRTWLFSVIRNTAADRRRKQKLRILGLAALCNAPTDESAGHLLDPAQAAHRSQEREQLEKAVNQLSGRQREILHLVFYQGMTIAEAAEVLHISAGSARTHYERGKARLRKLLGR